MQAARRYLVNVVPVGTRHGIVAVWAIENLVHGLHYGPGAGLQTARTTTRVRGSNRDIQRCEGSGGLEKTRTSDLLRVKQAL
jgi:hypothetical protein